MVGISRRLLATPLPTAWPSLGHQTKIVTVILINSVTIMTASIITATIAAITSTPPGSHSTDTIVEEERMDTVLLIAVLLKIATPVLPLTPSSGKSGITVTSYVALDSSQMNSAQNSVSLAMTKTRMGSEVAEEQISQHTTCIDSVLLIRCN